MTDTLADALPREIKRVRDEIIPEYEKMIEFAPMTELTVNIMKAHVNEGIDALASGDVVRMLSAHKVLEEYET